MFPTGPTEVMVTPPPLEPPRPGLDLAPDLVLGLALCEVFRLLGLPTRTPFSTARVGCPLIGALLVPVPQIERFPGLFHLAPRPRAGVSIAP